MPDKLKISFTKKIYYGSTTWFVLCINGFPTSWGIRRCHSENFYRIPLRDNTLKYDEKYYKLSHAKYDIIEFFLENRTKYNFQKMGLDRPIYL